MKQSPRPVRSVTRAVEQPSPAAPPAPSRASFVASSQHPNAEGRRHERVPVRTRWYVHIPSHISGCAPVHSAVTPPCAKPDHPRALRWLTSGKPLFDLKDPLPSELTIKTGSGWWSTTRSVHCENLAVKADEGRPHPPRVNMELVCLRRKTLGRWGVNVLKMRSPKRKASAWFILHRGPHTLWLPLRRQGSSVLTAALPVTAPFRAAELREDFQRTGQPLPSAFLLWSITFTSQA